MDHQVLFQKLNLKESYFDSISQLHGIKHTYRVMCHVFFLSEKHDLGKYLTTALCAAFIHDMARKHDGYCTQHGEWALQYKLPVFESFFRKYGLAEEEILTVGEAVENHSLMEELPKKHSSYIVTALLKDADALDRIRLGDKNLNEKFLRLPESYNMIPFAKKFYFYSNKIKFSSFTQVLKDAKLINQK